MSTLHQPALLVNLGSRDHPAWTEAPLARPRRRPAPEVRLTPEEFLEPAPDREAAAPDPDSAVCPRCWGGGQDETGLPRSCRFCGGTGEVYVSPEERAALAAEWAEDLAAWREALDADAAGRAALGDLDAVRALGLDRLREAELADREEAEAGWHARGEVLRLGTGRRGEEADYHVLPIEPGWHAVAFEIHGGAETYVAAQHDNGIASCTCPGATLGGRECKHLRGLVARGLMKPITATEG